MEPKAAGDKDMFWARSWASMTSPSWTAAAAAAWAGAGVHDMSPLLVTCCCCGCIEWCGASSVQCQLGSPLEAFNGFTIFFSNWIELISNQSNQIRRRNSGIPISLRHFHFSNFSNPIFNFLNFHFDQKNRQKNNNNNWKKKNATTPTTNLFNAELITARRGGGGGNYANLRSAAKWQQFASDGGQQLTLLSSSASNSTELRECETFPFFGIVPFHSLLLLLLLLLLLRLLLLRLLCLLHLPPAARRIRLIPTLETAIFVYFCNRLICIRNWNDASLTAKDIVTSQATTQ